jgi:hypothetical protein
MREGPRRVKASFDVDHPTMGRVPDVPGTIGRTGFSLVGHLTLPDEARWDDPCTPMERRIEEPRGKCTGDVEPLGVLDQLAREPDMHQRYSDCCAYERLLTRRG